MFFFYIEKSLFLFLYVVIFLRLNDIFGEFVKMKKVIIVGGGITGLATGVYAARSGFDVTILEQHFTFGGLSTSWSRKGYYFEGGMHWLTGSSPKFPMNNVWKETGALKENNPIENRDPLYTIYDGNKTVVALRRYLPDMEKELLDYAPEDSKMIKKMCKDIKAFAKFFMPVFDVRGCKCKSPQKQNIKGFMGMLDALLRVPRLVNTSISEYVANFKNENIRHLLKSVIGYRYNAISLIYTLGSFASGDCGYPHGGSVLLGQNMLDTFLSLGGKIQYKTQVQKVIVENGVAKGVVTNDGEIRCDGVIVTQDAKVALNTLFEVPLKDKWTKVLRKEIITEQNMFISLGVNADLSHLPYCVVLPLEKPFEFAGKTWTELRLYNYSKYKDHAPEGCTAITSLLIGDTYEYWKNAKEDGTYKAKKDELLQLFLDAVSKYLPEVKEKLVVTDVATPLTYERYCGSCEGSWMSVWQKGGKQHNFPQTLKSVKNVYFAGQRIQMPGGLPIAAYTGRRAVQFMCRDFEIEFV